MSIHDRWAGARTGVGKRWEIRWREAGHQHKQRFESRAAAERFDAKRRLDPQTRLAAEGRVLTIDQMMATWVGTKRGLEQNTQDAALINAREVTVAFGPRLAASLVPSEIQAWSGRNRGASLRRRSLAALGSAYRLAIRDRVLTVNPCEGIPLPKSVTREPRFLSWAELGALAEAAGRYEPLIWLLGTAGIRIGEAVGLQVGDVQGNRIRVSRAIKQTSKGASVGRPKSGRGRDVPVPAFVIAQLPVQGRRPGEWLFVSTQGQRVSAQNWRGRVFRPSVQAAGLDELHIHDLRHTAVSLAIAAGADVLVVQRMCGHASAVVTLAIYAHLWDGRLDEVSERMQEGAKKAHAYTRRAL